MMNDLLIELDDFNKIKQAACFNKRSNMTNCYRSDNPFMQIIGQPGRNFPTQSIPSTRKTSMHIYGIFAGIAAEGQFHAANHDP